MTRIYGDQGTYVYTFTYDAAGLLNKSTWTLDNKDDGTETYTYTNGQITKVNYKYASGDQGVNDIKYDAAGNILEFSYEPEDKSYHNIQYFEYDADGVFTKHGYKDVGGSIYFEAIRNPTKSVKSPENYLKAHGLPYDMLTGFSWSTNMGGEGTTIESFNYDEKVSLLPLLCLKILELFCLKSCRQKLMKLTTLSKIYFQAFCLLR